MNHDKYLSALKEAKREGIDFSLDYFQQHISDANFIAHLAAKYHYRKPANASGSTARYFYVLLQKVNQ